MKRSKKLLFALGLLCYPLMGLALFFTYDITILFYIEIATYVLFIIGHVIYFLKNGNEILLGMDIEQPIEDPKEEPTPAPKPPAVPDPLTNADLGAILTELIIIKKLLEQKPKPKKKKKNE